MAMLYLLHRFNIDTIVIHCNYQLRGEASDQDQKLVEEICMHWNLECVSLRFESGKESEGFNFQDWARRRRYQAFNDIREEYEADFILTAHHLDDQLETILQKILRGAGVASWKGMDTLDGNLYRPLLNISKSEIMEFVQEFNVPYRIDRTNEESTYARNFIRNHWFPDMNRLFPGWKQNLMRVADRAEEFQAMVDTILAQTTEGEGQLNREIFLSLTDKIQPAIFLEFIKKSGVDADVSQGFLENLDELKEIKSGGKIQLSEEFYIMRDRNIFKLVGDVNPGTVNNIIEKEDLKNAVKFQKFLFIKEQPPSKFSQDSLYVDLSQLQFPLRLRNWKPGDRIQPLGMEGTQLISDHLTNRKIPSALKNRALVLETFDEKICAVIFPADLSRIQIGTISENCRCTPQTKNTLTIRKVH